jgi:hypothetical protein
MIAMHAEERLASLFVPTLAQNYLTNDEYNHNGLKTRSGITSKLLRKNNRPHEFIGLQ